MSTVIRFLKRYPVVPLTVLVAVVVLVLHMVDLAFAAQVVATVFVAAFMLWTIIGMVRSLLKGQFGLDILAVVAMGATLAVGEYVASLIVVLMLSGGEALEDFASYRARRDLNALLERSPQRAHLLGADGSLQDVPVEQVRVGDVLLVRPSEIVPADAALLDDSAEFDESSLTGESLPVTKSAGDEVMSGSVNGDDAVRLRVLRPAEQSQYQQIVKLVAAAEDSRAPVVRLADRYAVPFTVVSLAIAGVAWAIAGDPARFAEVLVLATPCPLLIAAPVAFLGGLSQTSRRGVIVKGGAVLEQFGRIRSAAFDKTGTLTRGHPALIDVRPAAGFDAADVLRLAASAEQYSTHALADGIRAAAQDRGLSLLPASHAAEAATNGVTAVIDGRTVVVGKPAYIDALTPDLVREDLRSGEAAAYVAVAGRYAGALILADELRPESGAVVGWLREHGVERIVMLTGDARTTAESVASSIGVTEVHAELLPADKVRLASEMAPRPMLMVGDGVNDAPVLAAADIGVAMGAKGATAAGEAADAVIVADSLSRLVDAVRIGRHTLTVATTAIVIGIVLSVGLMLVATTGVIPAVAGALIQEVVDLATILYALRALRPPKGTELGTVPSAQPASVSQAG
ncbi:MULTISPECIES: heavy metal translocating P-type ATPase [unclassified Microbacterium]|uniref:heavy metal translocating P-type ATPase n=1 Tax=unclassified Microbacterium TaxID=2609290 RepID=UPI0012F75D50|nr:heavy metal translocating P-type ATPase [Microbacterium sp. MAH-37]MVQ42296.1 cadmium-translocating P-type ATPase [Microbacterium sp. MAH-37]